MDMIFNNLVRHFLGIHPECSRAKAEMIVKNALFYNCVIEPIIDQADWLYAEMNDDSNKVILMDNYGRTTK